MTMLGLEIAKMKKKTDFEWILQNPVFFVLAIYKPLDLRFKRGWV